MEPIENKGALSGVRSKVASMGMKTMAGIGVLAAVAFATVMIYLSNQASLSANVEQSMNVSYLSPDGQQDLASLPLGTIYTGDVTPFTMQVNNRGKTAQVAMLQMTCSDEGPMGCSDVILKDIAGSPFPCVANGSSTVYQMANQSWPANTKTPINASLVLDPHFTGALNCNLVAT